MATATKTKKITPQMRRTKSLWPKRLITRFIKGPHKGTRIAVLECGHKYATDMTKRKNKRCYLCLIEGPARRTNGRPKIVKASAKAPATQKAA